MVANNKYELIEIHKANITVDISELSKFDQMFFNATEMAKPFGKRPNDWLTGEEAQSYIEALLITRNSGNSTVNRNHLIKTRRGGKYGGTWLHHNLGLRFAS